MNRVIEFYNKKYDFSGAYNQQHSPRSKLKGVNIGPTTTFTNPAAAAASSNTPAPPLAGVAAAFAAAAAVNGGTTVATATAGGSGGGGAINSNPASTAVGTTTVGSNASINSTGGTSCSSSVRRIGNGEKYRRMENGSNLSQSMDSVNTVEKYAGEEEVRSKIIIFICSIIYAYINYFQKIDNYLISGNCKTILYVKDNLKKIDMRRKVHLHFLSLFFVLIWH